MLSLLISRVASLENRKPIILIPGAMRSKIFVNSTRKYSWYCPSETKDKQMWLNIFNFVPPYINCFFDSFTLDYNEEKDKPVDPVNVSSKIKDFGGLFSIKNTV